MLAADLEFRRLIRDHLAIGVVPGVLDGLEKVLPDLDGVVLYREDTLAIAHVPLVDKRVVKVYIGYRSH